MLDFTGLPRRLRLLAMTKNALCRGLLWVIDCQEIQMQSADFFNSYLNEFIKRNSLDKVLAIEYLAVLAIKGNVRNGDLECSEKRLIELNKSAHEFRLLSDYGRTSDSMRRTIKNFLLEDKLESGFKVGINISELYKRVEKRLKVPLRKKIIQDKAEIFLWFIFKDDAYKVQDAVDYLANLAKNGKVECIDMKCGPFSFGMLNGKAAELGLVSEGGKFLNKKGTTNEETQEALQEFFIEKFGAKDLSPEDIQTIYPKVQKYLDKKKSGIEIMR